MVVIRETRRKGGGGGGGQGGEVGDEFVKVLGEGVGGFDFIGAVWIWNAGCSGCDTGRDVVIF